MALFRAFGLRQAPVLPAPIQSSVTHRHLSDVCAEPTTDSTERGRMLTDAVDRALDAIDAKYADTDPADVPTSELRALARSVVLDAHQRDICAERLLIELKDAWTSATLQRPQLRYARGSELLNRIVSLCIHEFYTADLSGFGTVSTPSQPSHVGRSH